MSESTPPLGGALSGEWGASFLVDMLDACLAGAVLGAMLAFLYIIARNSQSLVVLARDVRQTVVARDAKRYGGEHG